MFPANLVKIIAIVFLIPAAAQGLCGAAGDCCTRCVQATQLTVYDQHETPRPHSGFIDLKLPLECFDQLVFNRSMLPL
jgi:hypothetical protein